MLARWLDGRASPPPSAAHLEDILARISYASEWDDASSAPARPKSPGAQAVQDADRLDAIGALGIARVFAYGGSRGQPMHDPALPPRAGPRQKAYRRRRRRQSTSLNHFHEKLLRLKDLMNTAAGRALAEERHRLMEGFLERFGAEWDGRAERVILARPEAGRAGAATRGSTPVPRRAATWRPGKSLPPRIPPPPRAAAATGAAPGCPCRASADCPRRPRSARPRNRCPSPASSASISSSGMRSSGAPEMYQLPPLSATIRPYFLSARSTTLGGAGIAGDVEARLEPVALAHGRGVGAGGGTRLVARRPDVALAARLHRHADGMVDHAAGDLVVTHQARQDGQPRRVGRGPARPRAGRWRRDRISPRIPRSRRRPCGCAT